MAAIHSLRASSRLRAARRVMKAAAPNLYTGKESRYERMDVLGTIQPEDLPGWAKHGLTAIQQEQAKKKTAKERER